MPIRSQMCSIMGLIEPEHPELFALEFGKITEFDFVYTLSSTNTDQSAPNLVKMYVTIRYQMSSIMDLIGAELTELFALEFAKIAESRFVYTLASTNFRPVSTKHGHNIYDNEILDEFKYGSNQTATSGVICPQIRKNCLI